MHSPPLVSYPVGRSRSADRLIGVGWVSGAGCAVAAAMGLVMQGRADWRAWVPCGAALLAGLSAWRLRRQAIEGELVFEDMHWVLSSGAGVVVATGRTHVCLDLQRLMLLRIEVPDRPACWLWVDRNADRARWRDLRRALYAGSQTAVNVELQQTGRTVSA